MKQFKLLAAFIVVFSLIPSTWSAPPWFIGNRQVPGPLPPNFSTIPTLDTQIGVVYGRAGSVNLLLDFAKPRLCRGQKVPLVVYVHGGWWVGGSRTGVIYTGIARALYQCGIAFASIDYRLTPAYTYKQIIGDCKLAIRFLRANADAFGIDPEKISIWGGSAGGHLVSLMGTAGDSDGLEGPGLEGVSSRPSAVVNDCGIEDLTTPWDATSNMIIGWFLGCPPATCPDKAKQASPSWQASADDPPILTLHGDHDPIVAYSQALALNKSLKNVGNKGAFICVVNGNHGFGPYTGGVTVTPNGTRQAWLRFFHLIRYIEPGVLCDLNVDGMVNNTDSAELDSLLGMYGINSGGLPTSPTWNTQADIYSDGRIDYKDWQTFSKARSVPPKFTLEIIPNSQVVASKDAITFRAIIRNLGQLDIHDYTLSFRPSPGLSFKSASEPVKSGQAIAYSNPLLPAYQSKTIDLTFSLSPGMGIPSNGLTLTSSAQFTSLSDTLPIEASAKVGVPSLSIQLVSSAMKAQAGDKLTFTAVVSNRSPYGVTNAGAWVDLPKGISFLSSRPSGTIRGSKTFFEAGSIASGGSVSIKILVQVGKGIESGNLLVEAGASSNEVHNVFDQAMLQIASEIPGSSPQILAEWSGVDTKTSAGNVGQAISVKVSIADGSSPYQVAVDWGNGNKQSSGLKSNGFSVFENIYGTSGDFEVVISCTDSAARSKITRRRIYIR